MTPSSLMRGIGVIFYNNRRTPTVICTKWPVFLFPLPLFGGENRTLRTKCKQALAMTFRVDAQEINPLDVMLLQSEDRVEFKKPNVNSNQKRFLLPRPPRCEWMVNTRISLKHRIYSSLMHNEIQTKMWSHRDEMRSQYHNISLYLWD